MNKDDKTVEEKAVNGPVKWIVATGVGLGSGIAKFVTDVRKEWYLNMRQSPAGKQFVESHGLQLEALKNNVKDGVISPKEFRDKYSVLKKEYFETFNNMSEELGIKSKGLEGLTIGSSHRFKVLSDSTKIPVVFGAIATTVIGFAGTAMLANSISSRNHMKHLEKALIKKNEHEATRN